MFSNSIFNLFLQQPPAFIEPTFFFMDRQSSPHMNMFGVPRPPYTNRQFREEEPKPVNLQKQQSSKKSKDQFTPNQGQYWNIEGDEALQREDYLKAIEHYTKAIDLSEGTESNFFRDRGYAYKQIKQLQQALQDAIQAIELDDKNIKAHLLCGQVMAEIGKSDNHTNNIRTSIIRLTKAMTLCAGQKKSYYEGQLSKYIYRAKKLLWFKQLELQNNQKRTAIINYQKYLETQDTDQQTKTDSLNSFVESIGNPDAHENREIPNHLICKITLDIMENPVVTEAGHTYERDVLVEHFKKNGAIDPTTRKPISPNFYPNQNIKTATEEFLLKNPWAFEFTQNEDYHDIEF